MKKTWMCINTLITNKKKESKSISAIQDHKNHSKIINDPSKLSNIINQHFATVDQKLANKIPEPKKHFSEYLDHINEVNSLFLTTVSKTEVECEILRLTNNKSYGLYSCPISMLKASRLLISEHLSNLINLFVQIGQYPCKLKTSKIIPIFKTDDDADPNNYRPISLLSVFNRINERLVYTRLINYIEKNNLVCDTQYGFRKAHSTQLNMLSWI